MLKFFECNEGEIKNGQNHFVELGCGGTKSDPRHIGVDAIFFPGVNIVGDVFEALEFFADNSIEFLYASHFIEHIENLDALIRLIHKKMINGGVVNFIVPHFSNPYFYSDPTHRLTFGLYTMSYFCRGSIFKRSVPKYNFPQSFELISADLIFKSSRPWYFRHLFKKFIQAIFNSNYFMKEFYEENLSHIFPCYEISFVLKK